MLWSTNHSQTPKEKVCVSEGPNSFLCNFVVKHAEIYSKNDCPFFSFRVAGDPSSVSEFNH